MKVLVVKLESKNRVFVKEAKGAWGEIMHLGSVSPRIRWGITWRAIKALQGERTIGEYCTLSWELGKYVPFSTWREALEYIEYPKIMIERALRMRPYTIHMGDTSYEFYDGILYCRHKDGKTTLVGKYSLREFCTLHRYKYWKLK